MIAYHKHPKDNNLWTFPDAYKDDESVESPYMSNASMRQFLDALGYNPDFEDQSPVPAKEFIARTTMVTEEHRQEITRRTSHKGWQHDFRWQARRLHEPDGQSTQRDSKKSFDKVS